MDAKQIKDYVIEQVLTGYYDFKAKEFSPYRADWRFDVIGLRKASRESRIIEVKSGRSDFLSDKKWRSYLPYATHFYFAAPVGAIRPEELPKEVGLIEVSVGPDGQMQHTYTKKCRRLPPISDELYVNLIEAAFVRLRYERDNVKRELKAQGKRLDSAIALLLEENVCPPYPSASEDCIATSACDKDTGTKCWKVYLEREVR